MLRIYRLVDRRIAADTRVQTWPWHRRLDGESGALCNARRAVRELTTILEQRAADAAVDAPSFRPLFQS